ncbi:MAG: peptidoglycan-binding protein [Patescibacteria group bacterium]
MTPLQKPLHVHSLRGALFFLILSLLAPPYVKVSAEAPTITSFVATNNTILMRFAWEISNGGGHSFSVPCIPNIRYYKTDFSSFACGTPTSISTSASAAFELFAANYSGGPTLVTAYLTPLDGSGTPFSEAARAVSLTIPSITYPIDTFDLSTTTISSAYPTLTLSWSTDKWVPGANFIFECRPSITIYEGTTLDGRPLPCGTIAYSTALPTTGGRQFTFKNSGTDADTVSISIIPSLDDGFDQTHPTTKSVVVRATKEETPSITVTPEEVMLLSKATTTISWVAKNSPGVRIALACANNSTILLGDPSITCTRNTEKQFPPTGSITIVGESKDGGRTSATLEIFPAAKDGTYVLGLSKKAHIIIGPISQPLPQKEVTPISPSVTLVPVPTKTVSPTPAFRFTKTIRRGSENNDVTELQKLLSRFPAIYPEKIVLGYFGAATERAVARLKVKYKIVGDPVGVVGPKTRAVLNSLSK